MSALVVLRSHYRYRNPTPYALNSTILFRYRRFYTPSHYVIHIYYFVEHMFVII